MGQKVKGNKFGVESKYRFKVGGTQRDRYRGQLLNAAQKMMLLQFQILKCRNKKQAH